MSSYNIHDPADLQELVNNGLIWKGGPKTLMSALKDIEDGVVERNPDREPPEVRAYLDKVMALPVDEAIPPVGEDELAAAPPAEDLNAPPA